VDSTPEMKALTSINEYIDYYCFTHSAYIWTVLSMTYRPKIIVEFGTASGLRTRLLSILNPGSMVYTIDKSECAGFQDKPTGFVAKDCDNVKIVIQDSSSFDMPGEVDMCFIDADHSEESVYKDSLRAWDNRNINNFCILWDDYILESVEKAVDRFVEERENYILYNKSNPVFIGTKILP